MIKKYIEMKAAEKWSVQKETIVDHAAVSEVLDENGNVIRGAVAEQSHEELQLVQKRFDHNTGEALDDDVRSYSLSGVANERSRIANQISSLQDEDANWAELEEDLKDL